MEFPFPQSQSISLPHPPHTSLRSFQWIFRMEMRLKACVQSNVLISKICFKNAILVTTKGCCDVCLLLLLQVTETSYGSFKQKKNSLIGYWVILGILGKEGWRTRLS